MKGNDFYFIQLSDLLVYLSINSLTMMV